MSALQINNDHHASLLAAIEALPTTDDDSWTVPAATCKAAGLADDVNEARKLVLKFSLWAREAVSRLPKAEPAAMQATDFNDYYKVVMSRVQFMYAQALAGAPAGSAQQLPICCFQTQLRRRPLFKKGGETSCSGIFDSKGSFTPKESGIKVEGTLEGSVQAFRAALQAVGARKFDAATLRALLASHHPKAAGIESSLAPLNEAWVSALDGKPLFKLLGEGEAFSEGEEVECQMVVEKGVATLLAQGPWFRVTFCETPLLQCMSQFFTDAICTIGDDDGVAWCREAMMNFATTIHQVKRHCPEGAMSLFSGRRAPNPAFHLLQHMYISEQLGGMATSSLLASRVLGHAGMPVAVIGTLAHEGPMGFMALHPELDEHMPLSSLLWHLLFWSCTANHTILPDAHGSAAFRAMIEDLGLLGDVTMARQDSGTLARFKAIYPTTPCMASEIETFADVLRGLELGYVAFGAGGFFGEKRRVVGPEFSLAAKLTKAVRDDGKGGRACGYAGKLGDCSAGSWAQNADAASSPPAKFIVSPEADAAGMYKTMLDYATKGDAWFDQIEGGAPAAGRLVRRADALKLAGHMRAIGATPALKEPACAAIAARLEGFAARIETAAAGLD